MNQRIESREARPDYGKLIYLPYVLFLSLFIFVPVLYTVVQFGVALLRALRTRGAAVNALLLIALFLFGRLRYYEPEA